MVFLLTIILYLLRLSWLLFTLQTRYNTSKYLTSFNLVIILDITHLSFTLIYHSFNKVRSQLRFLILLLMISLLFLIFQSRRMRRRGWGRRTSYFVKTNYFQSRPCRVIARLYSILWIIEFRSIEIIRLNYNWWLFFIHMKARNLFFIVWINICFIINTWIFLTFIILLFHLLDTILIVLKLELILFLLLNLSLIRGWRWTIFLH